MELIGRRDGSVVEDKDLEEFKSYQSVPVNSAAAIISFWLRSYNAWEEMETPIIHFFSFSKKNAWDSTSKSVINDGI